MGRDGARCSLGGGLLGLLRVHALERLAVALALQGQRGHKTLDLGGLGGGLLALLGRELSPDDEFADVVLFRQVLSDGTRGARQSAHVLDLVRPDGIQILTNIFRILLARLGPKRLGTLRSVRPGMSSSPFLTTINDRAAMSGPTMQPRTDLRLRSPLRRGR